VTFGLSDTADVRPAGAITVTGNVGECQAFDALTPTGTVPVRLSLAGTHNVKNALATVAVGVAMGCTTQEISAGLAKMRPVKGRLNIKRASRGGCIIDDSYNANPSSVEASLGVLSAAKGERWMVLGNMAELGSATEKEHLAAGLLARESGVTRLFLVGNLAAAAAQTFGPGAEAFDRAEDLVRRLENDVVSGVTLLVKGSRVNRLERVVDALEHGRRVEG
jgi:UDP-N-acetylmuramoyl-tripeptide--D-alanyl-D-alanine ligase